MGYNRLSDTTKANMTKQIANPLINAVVLSIPVLIFNFAKGLILC